jgi:scyllo-inositol 2-dehydrogenase (NADP+)
MKVIVVGLGVQGHKRRKFAGADYVACVDPVNPEAEFRSIYDVPTDSFDTALCCIPDEPKYEVISYLLTQGKNVLVEKPLWTVDIEDIRKIEACAQSKGVLCYTAYNHRFEPHFIRMRDLVASGELGRIYSCRMFYGNGTARLVRNSDWRDRGAGVLPDLGSHLLDTCRFWFGDLGRPFEIFSMNCFENRALDHVVIGTTGGVRIELEMTLLSWRNHFTCDILAENGSAHIESLCKWGPSTFTHRRRILPSGCPPQYSITLVQDDPTWEAEYTCFTNACRSKQETDLTNDIWLRNNLARLERKVLNEMCLS